MKGKRSIEALLGRLLGRVARKAEPWPVPAKWKCPGTRRPHPVKLIHAEHLHDVRDDSVDIHRCETCGRSYLCHTSEINDWGSEGGDYSSILRLWWPLETSEFGAARADPAYAPRSTISFREEPGWRRA